MSSQFLIVRELNVALLLCSSNITNSRPKMGWQLLVVVGSWAGNAVSGIKSVKDTWSENFFMVSLISIAMVCYLNGFSYSTFAVSVRVW